MLLIYKTVIELFPVDLDASVNKHLKDEWSLHGSPYVCPLRDEDHPALDVAPCIEGQ